MDGCASILNVGAGAASYEPQSRTVVAVEPSSTMIAQRPSNAAPVVQACAEALPFRDVSSDAVLGVLTAHHWKNRAKGLSECARVARSRVVFLSIDFDVCARFWLFDYVPELLRVDRAIFPSIEQFAEALGSIEIMELPIPADCRDGFLCDIGRAAAQISLVNDRHGLGLTHGHALFDAIAGVALAGHCRLVDRTT
jgi:SAM-dependent methyltransferase